MTNPDRQPTCKEALSAQAVVLEAPGQLRLQQVEMATPGEDELLIEVMATGISSGTERLLWAGEMPDFPGMGYPLIPGYETIGRIADCGTGSEQAVGDWVFVGGTRCFPGYRSLFGGAASHMVVPQEKAQPIDAELGHDGLLLALAATAYHALHVNAESCFIPDLVIGHGVLGRLLARICVALGHPPPTVWEISAARRDGATGYRVIDPAEDVKRDYQCVVDASGDASVLDRCLPFLGRRTPGGKPPEVVLAGFYKAPVSFQFAQAFMRELRIQVAAEWQPSDLNAVSELVRGQQLSLSGLITHTMPSAQAAQAYEIAFRDEQCLKMVLDWGARVNV